MPGSRPPERPEQTIHTNLAEPGQGHAGSSAGEDGDLKNMPFDGKRMIWDGFKTLVEI